MDQYMQNSGPDEGRRMFTLQAAVTLVQARINAMGDVPKPVLGEIDEITLRWARSFENYVAGRPDGGDA